MKNLGRPSYTTIVFDLGNVLIGWDPFIPLSDHMNREEWVHFAQDVDFFTLNSMADNGTLIEDVITLATKKNQHHGELIRQYYEHFEKSLTGPISGVAEIIEELSTSGLRLFGLTNWSAETFHHALKITPAIDHLEAIMISGQERTSKPSSLIFRSLIEKYAIQPSQTVFIDDTPRNTHTAVELGFMAIQFTGAKKLRENLRYLKILK